jgi:hypothetical protein
MHISILVMNIYAGQNKRTLAAGKHYSPLMSMSAVGSPREDLYISAVSPLGISRHRRVNAERIGDPKDFKHIGCFLYLIKRKLCTVYFGMTF